MYIHKQSIWGVEPTYEHTQNRQSQKHTKNENYDDVENDDSDVWKEEGLLY